MTMGAGCTSGTNVPWAAPVFDSLRLGWTNKQASPPIEAWIDDIAIDSKPIACPASTR